MHRDVEGQEHGTIKSVGPYDSKGQNDRIPCGNDSSPMLGRTCGYPVSYCCITSSDICCNPREVLRQKSEPYGHCPGLGRALRFIAGYLHS